MDFLGQRKVLAANKLLRNRDNKLAFGKEAKTQEEIASIINVRPRFLSGELTVDSASQFSGRDILAIQSYAEEYTDLLRARGVVAPDAPDVDIWNVSSTR